MYKTLQQQLQSVDQKLTEMLEQNTLSTYELEENVLTKKQTNGKNQPKIKVQELAYKLYGTDLSAIPGVGPNTLLSVMTELGTCIDKFPNSKAFVSWLRLAPNNKVSGGKVLSSRTPKGVNPLSIALRDAANVIGNQKTSTLTHFFKRIGLKKGRCAAITATARKLGTIIYTMIKNKTSYNHEIPENISEKIKAKKIKYLKSIAAEQGFLVIDNQGVALS